MFTNSRAFGAFYRWLLFTGLVVAGLWAAYDHGLVEALFSADRSTISLLILAFFLVFSLHAGRRAWRLGRQLEATRQLAWQAARDAPLLEIRATHDILVAGSPPSTSFAHEHLAFLAEKYRQQNALSGQDLLLERLDVTLRHGHQTGWFIADLMIRLGLLGTVIGFIFMLGSVATIDNVDLQTMQQLLTNMSGGMRVALYTTLAGLSAGILLGFQYQLLDQAADHLLSEIIELSEVHAARHLRRLLEE